MDNKELLETLKAGLGNGLIVTFEMYTTPGNTNYMVRGVLKGIDWQGKWHLRNLQTKNVETCNWGNSKPHLFPLSMLTKPIKVSTYNSGKEFVPITRIEKMHHVDDNYNEIDALSCLISEDCRSIEFIRKDIKIENMPWVLVNQLHEWHFNVFNLDTEKFIDASISKVYEKQ